MIPSLNPQGAEAKKYYSLKEAQTLSVAKPEDWRAYAGSDLSFICDCCLETGGPIHDGFHDEASNPRLVVVKGMTYYSCSVECARILFNIHHQYAMREAAQEGRFFTDSMGRTLDLDRVIVGELIRHPDADHVKFMLEGGSDFLVQFPPPGCCEASNKLLEAWKARPSPKDRKG